ncbi:MAG: permease-like cell division protein FtsX [Clostridiales bacterium]|jgi:cell division transport system permease protein|nr:permease-like cell division protein FtsX [Clostridiales bacterium]
MKFRSIRYYLKEAFKSLIRNRLMSVASILTVASCTMIFIFSYCIAVNLDGILEQIEGTVGLSAIIEDSLDAKEVNALYEELLKIEHISSIGYISKDMALENAHDIFGQEHSDLLDGLAEDNPLPRSFTIALDSNMYQEQVVEKLSKFVGSGFESIQYESEITNILLTVNRGIRIISAVIILAFVLISVVLIMNTIKLTVNMRSVEIGIMKYVGATDWFIRWPFIIEGMIIGVLGAGLPLAVGWLSYNKVLEIISGVTLLSGLNNFKTVQELFWVLIPLSTFSGMLIGSIGSILSMRRYLKV